MKKIILSAFLLSAYAANAQDLAYKIPKNAMAVASVRGEQLLQLMTVAEFDQSYLGKELLEEINYSKRKDKFKSIEDFGIKLNGTVYYFNQQTDSISYNCLLIPLADAQKFEKIFKQRDRDKIVRNGENRKLYNDGDKALLNWNNEFAYFVFGDLKDKFLEEDSVMAERYGIKEVNYSDYYNNYAPEAVEADDSYAVDTAYGVVEAYPVVEATKDEYYEGVKEMAYEDIPVDAPPPPVMYVEPKSVGIDRDDEEDDDAPVMVQVEEQTDYIDAPPVVAEAAYDVAYTTVEAAPANDFNTSAYNKAYEQQRAIKSKLTTDWVNGFASKGFSKTSINNSILENAAYLRSLDNSAVATFYLSDMQSLYTGFLPYVSRRYFGLSNIMEGYGSVNAKLFMDNEAMRITSEMEVDEAKATAYKKMYKRKPNKKFAKYINSDKMVGFVSYSLDTEEYLNEFPKMLNSNYGRIFGLYSDEIGLSAELFSLLLDEKAVAKVVKGDAILLLNDIGPKEYTYTTYDYDDDYKRTEVKKTKTETLPDFLFMMSTDDTRLIMRLLNYGINKEKVTLKNGIYTLDNKITRGNPFSIHVLIKDGILFCGTSYRDIQQISTDNYHGNLSKEHRNLLLKNNMSMLFNPKNIVGKISAKEFGNVRKLTDFNNLMGSTGPMYARTTGVKNNRISGEMVAEVPQDKVNALKYFFSLIEQAAKLD